MRFKLMSVWTLLLSVGFSATVAGQTPRKIIDNGPDSERLVLVVLGDGYAAKDQKTFQADYERLVTKGLLHYNLYAKYAKAINVYVVDLVSQDSGISTKVSKKNTALMTQFVGGRCYVSESDETITRIRHATLPIEYNQAIVLLNIAEYGGCAFENRRMYITRGMNERLVAHEYGHTVSALFDEYVTPGRSYTGSPVNERNCSTATNANLVAWKQHIAGGTPIPSDGSSAAIGMFQGCNNFSSGIYRPTPSCLMGNLKADLCPVCRETLTASLAKYQAPPAPKPGGAPSKPVNHVDVLVRVFRDGSIRVLDARDMAGPATTTAPGTSDFFYEVKRNGVAVSVAGLMFSAFETRGYAAPDDNIPHSRQLAESATLRLRIPELTTSQISDGELEVNVYRANQGQPQLLPNVVTPLNLQQLREQAAVKMELTMPSGIMREAIRQYQISPP